MDFHRVKREQGVEEEDELVAGRKEEGVEEEDELVAGRKEEACIPCKDASFLRTMKKSHAINGMSIPRKFYNEFKKNFDRGIILQRRSPQSRAWHVGISYKKSTGPYGSYFLASGWNTFVNDNEIEVGDIMVFRLIKHNLFSFEIYGAEDGLEKIDSRVAAAAAKGQSSDSSEEGGTYDMGKETGTRKLMHKKNHWPDEIFKDEKSRDSEDDHDQQQGVEPPPMLPNDSVGSVRILVRDFYSLFIKAPYHSAFPRTDMRIFLIDCNKKKWPVSWHSKARTMAGGFAAFAHHHRIRIGDSLHIDPQGKNHFRVTLNPAAANAKDYLKN